ncbi:hypothetical protein N7457_005821 [Penicillium paradoxum]|uniref:uncharacterized protein n=1 Tax=Penicillium paradoxum TaxID=176176 RepID=UPI002546C49A|nr:uncharacterized protein N7457_005821 [Penicillium paradoxum]KAJ5780661.1 hypothetical protein N7457_005821 [Penicillium paradoxum]
MRSSLVLLAGLAGSALAYPTELAAPLEPRTLGLLGELLGDLTVDVTSILGSVLHHGHSSVSLLAGLKVEGAAALQAGALGCKSGAIHHKAKLALKTWLLFHADFDRSLKKTLISWCEGNEELVLSDDILAALAVYVPGLAQITAQGQLYVTVDGIFDAAKLESALVLNMAAQASLSAWIEAKASLDVAVKVGLHVCAAGGVVSSLSADIKAALHAWISSTECDLSAHLKVSVLAWIKGHAGGDLIEIGALAETALSTISVGASVGVYVEESGLLSLGGQGSLAAFLGADLSAGLAADVKLALEACARGKLATAVELDIRTKLAIWLAGADCSLGVELKAVVLLWLSFGVEADVSASLDLVGGLLGHVTGILTESVLSGLSVDLRAALSLCAAGGGLTGLSLDARAELAAFLAGCTSIDIDISIQIIIIQWFTGCSIPGAPSGSHSSSVPSLPFSTPSLPGTSGVPSGPGASVSVTGTLIPGHPAATPSGVAPTGLPSVSGSPSGPAATSTPCDTETSEIIGSTVIPGGPDATGSITVSFPAVPTATGPAETTSGVAPTGIPGTDGPAPSGPAATSVPCDTEASEIIGSTVIPGGPDATGSNTVSLPAVPTATGPAETTSGVAPTGIPGTDGPAPSGPAATSVPCDTETSEIIGSTVIPGGPAPSGPAPTTPPTQSTGSDSTVTQTQTQIVTVTATVCNCE